MREIIFLCDECSTKHSARFSTTHRSRSDHCGHLDEARQLIVSMVNIKHTVLGHFSIPNTHNRSGQTERVGRGGKITFQDYVIANENVQISETLFADCSISVAEGE